MQHVPLLYFTSKLTPPGGARARFQRSDRLALSCATLSLTVLLALVVKTKLECAGFTRCMHGWPFPRRQRWLSATALCRSIVSIRASNEKMQKAQVSQLPCRRLVVKPIASVCSNCSRRRRTGPCHALHSERSGVRAVPSTLGASSPHYTIGAAESVD
jgi:hypothetical protein